MSVDDRATPPAGQLPANYDALVSIDQLIHGEHNPRRVRPKSVLKESIAKDGLERPLIVRPADDSDRYHITDGWQRYQAATAAGWERLPVEIYESSVDALKATETASIVREWSTYEWATYCESLAGEIAPEATGTYEAAKKIAPQTTRSLQTVYRYLGVLSLPDEVHPLLTDGPAGDPQQWAALKNYNPSVKQYGDLRWSVAAAITRGEQTVNTDRQIGIAAIAVRFDDTALAKEFVEQACSEPEVPLELIQNRVQFGGDHTQYLQLPRQAIRMDVSQRKAIMDYCRQTKQTLTEVIEASLKELDTDGPHSDS